MTTNDLIYKITARAKELADKPLLELRLGVATAETVTGAIAETKHLTRGELVEQILEEEFVEEYPKQILEED